MNDTAMIQSGGDVSEERFYLTGNSGLGRKNQVLALSPVKLSFGHYCADTNPNCRSAVACHKRIVPYTHSR